MHGLVTLLEPEHDAKIKAVWRVLEDVAGLRHLAHRVPFPHFSWLVCADYDAAASEAALRRISARMAARGAPVTTKTTGLGLFTGAQPVLYAAVTRTPELSAMHALICEEFRAALREPSPYYEPANWMPHITLAEGDLTPDALAAAMRALATQDFSDTIRVDNLVWAHDTGAPERPHELRLRMSL